MSRHRRGLAAAVLAGALVAAGAPSADARYAVGERSYVFTDKSRPTPANGSYAGAPSRTLRTLLLYPAKKGRPVERRGGFPLIVFSHGLGAVGPAYRSALEPWVRRGYAVAAPTFPSSSGTAPGGPSLAGFEEQPADVSFVIDRVLARAGLRRTVSRTAIGAAGHSLGAATSLALTANSCCRDRRVDAVVTWSGLQLQFAGGTWFKAKTKPLLLVHGTADPIYPASEGIYSQASRPKAFVTLIGAPHIPNQVPWVDPTVRSTADWFDAFLKRDRRGLERLKADANVPGAASLRAAGLRCRC
jgi:dienelactone hydrolase